MASTVGAGDGRDQHRSGMYGGQYGSARWVSCTRLHWRSLPRRFFPTSLWVPRLVRRRPLAVG